MDLYSKCLELRYGSDRDTIPYVMFMNVSDDRARHLVEVDRNHELLKEVIKAHIIVEVAPSYTESDVLEAYADRKAGSMIARLYG